MDDLCLLLPQIKKESKFDSKKKLNELNELAELNGASHVILFEPRKPFELFMWIAASPSGPSVRMHVRNIHTLDELSLPGNGMRGARPILTFDAALLNIGSHGDILKKLLTAAFAPPQRHRKTRPYTDRVMHFAWQDGHIWVRNYQLLPVNSVAESELQKVVQGVQAIEGMNVVEIGPRFVLCPIRILEGAFWGRTLWQNDEYVSPAVARAAIRLESAIKSRKRMADQEISSIRKSRNVLPRNELDDVFS